MKLFGKKAAPPAARPALGVPGGFAMPPRELPEARLRAGYCDNAIASRAVRLVAEGLGGAPLVASDPALLALVAARSSGQALLETLAAQLLLGGNAYVQLIAGEDGALAELFALRPDRVRALPDARGWPTAYRYRLGETALTLSATAPRAQIVHLKRFHPLDDHYGLGCLDPARAAIAVHNAAARWNQALLDNAARPSGALIHEAPDGVPLSREQFEMLRAELDASFAGAANAGRPLLLEGGLKWQPLGLSPADMDFVGLKAAAAREIACAFGVPPMLLGLAGDATYANYREAGRALWRQAILPLAELILGGLAEALADWFPGARLALDLDRVPALAEDRERLWAQVSAADFLSPAEKRAALGLAPLES